MYIANPSIHYTKNIIKGQGEEKTRIQIAKAFPWFLFGYFVMAGLNTFNFLSTEVIKGFSSSGKFLILLGLAGIGLNTVFSSFRKIGLKPLIVGSVGALVVASCSIIMISLFL